MVSWAVTTASLGGPCLQLQSLPKGYVSNETLINLPLPQSVWSKGILWVTFIPVPGTEQTSPNPCEEAEGAVTVRLHGILVFPPTQGKLCG